MMFPIRYAFIVASTFLLICRAQTSDAAAPRISPPRNETGSPKPTPPRPDVSPSSGCTSVTKTNFSDDKFPAADWDTSVLPAPASTQGYATTSVQDGGNPAEFRNIQITIDAKTPPSNFVHLLKGYSFNPSADGAIITVDGGYDLKKQNPRFLSASVALLLFQDGQYFRGPLDSISDIAWKTVNRPALKATDFVNLSNEGPRNPLFACDGKAIQVGFVVIPAKGSDLGVTSVSAIDNWSLRFNATCCSGPPSKNKTTIANRPVDANSSAVVAASSPQETRGGVPSPERTPAVSKEQGDTKIKETGVVASQCCCDDDEAVVDKQGTVIAPPNMDPDSPPVFEYVDQEVGNVSDLYPGADTTIDTWTQKYPCKPAIGGTVPDEAENPDIDVQLEEQNVDTSYDDVNKKINSWEKSIAAEERKIPFKWTGPAAPKYVPPVEPYKPPQKPGIKYAFGGRDIIFVHGLKLEHILDRIQGKSAAQVDWQQPTTFPASTTNPAFYTGYYKKTAEPTWIGSSHVTAGGHFEEFLRSKGYYNRYLVVSYNCSERLDVAVKAILAQIGDAMVQGIGVVDPTSLGGPPPRNFGTPSFVIVSHSTGGLVTDVALTAAAQNPSLQADYIPKYCKAHIAAHGAHRGSKLATAAIALSGYSVINPPPWLWQLVRDIFVQINPPASNVPATPTGFQILAKSILLDLVPAVAQSRWGSHIHDVPVRTLTVVGAHPTFLQPFKFALLPGFDDGVANVDSQVANPNSIGVWPAGFRTDGAGLVQNFDMGVFGIGPNFHVNVLIGGNLVSFSVNIKNTSLNSPSRAINYYINQKIDRVSSPLNVTTFPQPFFFASGVTPYISPTGMLQTIAAEYGPGPGVYPLSANPLNRNPNIFSYLQSASDHFKGTHDQVLGYNGVLYGNSPIYDTANGERNFEETRVITDPAVYAPYTMPYGDNEPLLRTQNIPAVKERVRGLRVTFTLKLFKKKWTKQFWIWKRRYHLLDGWETKRQFDYVYESVLKN
jgi:hypothetical protein